MSGYSNLHSRLIWNGGQYQQDRMVLDKLRSLKASIGKSYQTATISLGEKFDQDFKCLINPDKLKNDYDQKLISIPYKSIQLNAKKRETTTKGEVDVPIKSGDVFYWKETDSYWIIYLQNKEELAYFRGEIRQCKTYVMINDHKYYIYFKGPDETTIPWQYKQNNNWNDKNYSSEFYITKNEETLDYFHRFTKVEIKDKMWEVAATNDESGDGIIKVCLSEYYNNKYEKEMLEREKQEQKEKEEQKESIIEQELPYIEGGDVVRPYDTVEYTIMNAEGGVWTVSNKKAAILSQDGEKVTISIITGKSGAFILKYIVDGEEVAALNVEIKSI